MKIAQHVCWQTAVRPAAVALVQLSVFCPLVTSIPSLATSERVSSQAGRALQTRPLALVHKCYWHPVFADPKPLQVLLVVCRNAVLDMDPMGDLGEPLSLSTTT